MTIDKRLVLISKLGKLVDTWPLSLVITKAEDYVQIDQGSIRMDTIYSWTAHEILSFVYDRYCDELTEMGDYNLHQFVVNLALEKGLIDLDDLEGVSIYE
jgi:hypothetical protein